MAWKKIREYDSKGLLKEYLKCLSGLDFQICFAQVSIISLSIYVSLIFFFVLWAKVNVFIDVLHQMVNGYL